MEHLDEIRDFYQLASRCLSGAASDAEREQLIQRLKEPETLALFKEMNSGGGTSREDIHAECDVEDISRRVLSAVGLTLPGGKPAPSHGRWHQFSGPALAIAASMAIAAVSMALWFKPGLDNAAKTQPVAWVQETCGVGERGQVTLDDNTKITLNSGSTLSHPKKFGARSRVVRLTGEAFFDVTHDEAHPFVIETSTLRIKVLGTQFNVRAFSDGSAAKVSLVKGSVEVSELAQQGQSAQAAPKTVHLSPGQQFDFAPKTGKAEVQPISTETATGWMQDRFIWKDEPAASAMRQLERRYGIAVEFTDPKLGQLALNVRFEGESLEEIFDALRLTKIFNNHIEYNNGKIVRVILSPGELAHLSASTKESGPSTPYRTSQPE